MLERGLAFGLNKEVPATVTTAWGARWIFPNDQLYDRQDFVNPKSPAGQKLMDWLDGGAIKKAMATAAKLPKTFQRDDLTVTLFEDTTAIIKGNPQASHGYLYVCAYLKEEI